MITLVCIVLAQALDNLTNPETLTISGLLIAYIFSLRAELKASKDQMRIDAENNEKKIKALIDRNEEEIKTITNYYRDVISKLVEKNETLQKEKYEVTREVIPLLIELISKLNSEEQK